MAISDNGHVGAITTREFLDQKIEALTELSDVRFKASETAVNTALATQEKAVNAAFLASEKALTAALQASEKAISKSETSQGEVNKVIAGLQRDVISLRESRSIGVGNKEAKSGNTMQSNWVIGVVISSLFSATAFGLALYHIIIK